LIQSVECKDCRITKFRDDKDTNLLEDNPAEQGEGAPPDPGRRPLPPQAPESPFTADVDPSGHHATVTVHAPHLPASSASKILLDANLVVKYARGERTVEQKNVNLKLDKITVGPIPMIVATQSDAEAMMGRGIGMQAGMQVLLFHQGPQLGIKKLAFIGPDGNEIQAQMNGSGSNGFLHQTYYHLPGKVETCTIRVTVPEVIETATVAISVSTGVGFPPGVRRSFVPTPAPAANGVNLAPR
jgi:hypothetical protein